MKTNEQSAIEQIIKFADALSEYNGNDSFAAQSSRATAEAIAGAARSICEIYDVPTGDELPFNSHTSGLDKQVDAFRVKRPTEEDYK